jgi:hypothetical protein
MAVEAAGDHAAAVKEHKTRQVFACVVGGRVETVTKIAGRARQDIVDPDHRRHVGAGELHEFGQRLAALVGRRP